MDMSQGRKLEIDYDTAAQLASLPLHCITAGRFLDTRHCTCL
jgi:hypothetical protein